MLVVFYDGTFTVRVLKPLMECGLQVFITHSHRGCIKVE